MKENLPKTMMEIEQMVNITAVREEGTTFAFFDWYDARDTAYEIGLVTEAGILEGDFPLSQALLCDQAVKTIKGALALEAEYQKFLTLLENADNSSVEAEA